MITIPVAIVANQNLSLDRIKIGKLEPKVLIFAKNLHEQAMSQGDTLSAAILNHLPAPKRDLPVRFPRVLLPAQGEDVERVGFGVFDDGVSVG